MKQGLRFSFIPAAGIETASSRIRVFTLQRALEKLNIQATLGFRLNTDILFFQKKVTRRRIWQARIAKALGRIVIYDVDDLGDALWYWVSEKNLRKMLRIADAVTTCSVNQLNFLVSKYEIRKGFVISNSIDYFPTAPMKIKPSERARLRVVWYGNSSNFSLFEKYMDALLTVPNLDVFAIVNEADLLRFRNKQPVIHYLPWSVDNFISTLQQCDLAVLMHDGKPEDYAKGNNKMITAITWGVPAVVSRTPEYERTAREAGIEYALFSDRDELGRAIERLRSSEARAKYLDAAQPEIWNRYSPDAIASQVLLLAQEISNGGNLRRCFFDAT